jgi:8-oxo-dGTP pyrophosphatase MutT (NUDIX family)
MAHVDIAPCREPGRRHGALTLVRNRHGRVLLVRPSYTDGWYQLPGGAAHADEPPHVARWRELAEETGLHQPGTGALLLVDWMPANPEKDASEGLNLVFDGGVLDDDTAIVLPALLAGQEKPELTGWVWVPPDRLATYCEPYQYRRILAALAVLEDPTVQRYRVKGEMPPEVTA